MKKIKLIIAALIISSTIISCSGNGKATTENTIDPEITRIDGILKDCKWVGFSTYAAHILLFDGQMFTYVINDAQNGYVREDGRFTGTYKIDKGDNGNYYITISRQNKEVMFMFTKDAKRGYYLQGEIDLVHDSKD